MKSFHAVLLWCYRMMLRAYPSAYREAFANEMDATFCQLLSCDGRTPFRALLILLREVRSWPRNVLRAHRYLHHAGLHGQGPILDHTSLLSIDEDGGEVGIACGEVGQTVPILPWSRVLMAILPGIFIVMFTWANFNWGVWSGVLLIALCIMLIGIGIYQERTLPVWCYPAVGLLLCAMWVIPNVLLWMLPMFGLALLLSWVYALYCLLVVRRWIPWQSWLLVGVIAVSPMVMWSIGYVAIDDADRQWLRLVTTIFETLALPYTSWLALALVPLALRQGLRAALLVLGVGFWIWMFGLDFDYFLGGAWSALMGIIWATLLLIVLPIWVLRTKSSFQHELGLILPVLCALILVTIIETLARYAPHLVTDYVDFYRYLPNLEGQINGVGARVGEPMWPALFSNLAQAQGILVHWIFVVMLYRMLERATTHAQRMNGIPGWQRLRAVLLMRRHFFARG